MAQLSSQLRQWRVSETGSLKSKIRLEECGRCGLLPLRTGTGSNNGFVCGSVNSLQQFFLACIFLSLLNYFCAAQMKRDNFDLWPGAQMTNIVQSLQSCLGITQPPAPHFSISWDRPRNTDPFSCGKKNGRVPCAFSWARICLWY